MIVVSIPGTSEVSEKLKLPVDPLAKYLQEQHGLTQESTYIHVHVQS